MNETAVVNAEHVNKSFGNTLALKDFSTSIVAGTMVGLVGPDGSGKSTLIRLLVGLLLPDTGQIYINGLCTVKDADKIHDIVGYMPQKFGLYDDLTVIENLSLYADLRHITGTLRKEKFKRLLDFTKLAPFSSRLAGKLSGGMKQKLGLACSLIGEPQVLFLDEPSVGVDPLSRRELWDMVQALLTDGMTVVWSTAYLNEAEKCDSVILLNEGENLYEGRSDALVRGVQGRTWHINNIEKNKRRSILMHLLAADSVVDGVIQGNALRVVIGKKYHIEDAVQTIAPLLLPLPVTYHSVPSSFEDAFIDIIYTSPIEVSALAARIPLKDTKVGSAIKAVQLTKVFGDFVAVDKVNFDIERGEIFGLLGPNGAGKSTTFKMMCGLLQPSSGEASVAGLDLKTATSEARSRIGYMAQKFSLYANLTVRQNLEFFAGVYGLSGRQVRKQIGLMTDVFDLKQYLTVQADILPLGYKQRLSLACAVMHQPDVLFLDEPTSGVDPLTRREFWNHINGMVDKGVTVMITTHFMDEAEYCDRIGLIYQGKTIATGTPDELKSMVSTPLPKDDISLEDAFIFLVEQTIDNAELEQNS